MPGHEIVGRVTAVGDHVTLFKVGDLAAVGYSRAAVMRGYHGIFTPEAFAGSNIGGIAETQEMLDFCARHGIVAEIEKIGMGYVNKAFERLEKGDVHYRFVIDMLSL